MGKVLRLAWDKLNLRHQWDIQGVTGLKREVRAGDKTPEVIWMDGGNGLYCSPLSDFSQHFSKAILMFSFIAIQ